MSYQPNQPKRDELTVVLPHSAKAELGLINLAVRDAKMLYRLEEAGITEKFFYSECAAYLYMMLQMLTVEGKGAHPSQFNILQHLLGMGEQAGPILEYYRKASAEYIPAEWFDGFMRELVNTYKKREHYRTLQEALLLVFNEKVPADAITTLMLDRAEATDRATNPLNVTSGPQLEKLMREYYSQSASRERGASWGLAILDAYTGGARYGEFSILYAPPGIGKSALLTQAFYKRALEKLPQLYVTIGDMSKEQIIARIMQQLTGLGVIEQMRGEFKQGEGWDEVDHWDSIDEHLTRIGGLEHFYIYEDSHMKSTDLPRLIKGLLRKLPKGKGLHVYVDYMQQFTDPSENVYELVKTVSLNLMRCAKGITGDTGEKLVSVTGISNTNAEGKVKGGTDPTYDAENVYRLEAESVANGGPDPSKDPGQQSGVVKFVIEKQRFFGRGTLKLYFDAPRAVYREVARER
jgi:replicative DNA helicase